MVVLIKKSYRNADPLGREWIRVTQAPETFLSIGCFSFLIRLMRNVIIAALLGVLALTTHAQQPPNIGMRLNSIVSKSGEPQTKNYQLELIITRAGKTARYRMAFNGGSVQTDLIDKLAEQSENAEPRTMSFSVNLNPFDDGGGEATVFIGRSVPFSTKGKDPSGQERNVVQQRSIGLTTKVALHPGKPVLLFDDEDQKITLKLTEL
jgi:hypothetical protein